MLSFQLRIQGILSCVVFKNYRLNLTCLTMMINTMHTSGAQWRIQGGWQRGPCQPAPLCPVKLGPKKMAIEHSG